MIRNLPAIVIAIMATPCFASPVGFADSWMVMGSLGNTFNQLDTMYSPTARYSIGAALTQMENSDTDERVQIAVGNYNRLLWRVNQPESQFNGYLTLGAGSSRSNRAFQADRDQPVIAGGLQLDYETRRIYVAAKTNYWKSSRFTVGYNNIQAGFSFYKTEWDEIQPWLLAEVSRMPGIDGDYDKAIYLRLISKAFFADIGIDNDGRPAVNFRYTF